MIRNLNFAVLKKVFSNFVGPPQLNQDRERGFIARKVWIGLAFPIFTSQDGQNTLFLLLFHVGQTRVNRLVSGHPEVWLGFKWGFPTGEDDSCPPSPASIRIKEFKEF